MTPAVALRRSASQSRTLSLFEGTGGEPTLDNVLAGAWEGLAARATVACLICGERMEPVFGARDDRGGPGDGGRSGAPEGARCTNCGSSLS